MHVKLYIGRPAARRCALTWKHSGKPVSAHVAPCIIFAKAGPAVKILAWT